MVLRVRLDKKSKLVVGLMDDLDDEVRLRLVCESMDGSEVIMEGSRVDGRKVCFNVPSLMDRVRPGHVQARIEAMALNEMLDPITLDIEFIKPRNIVLESADVIDDLVGVNEFVSTKKRANVDVFMERLRRADKKVS